MARLTSEQAFVRAECLRLDWEKKKYPTLTAIAAAYGIAIPYAKKIIDKEKCYRNSPPGKENKDWKRVKLGATYYGVYRDGRIWSFSINAFLTLVPDAGYHRFFYSLPDGGRCKVRVHRIVLTTWKRPPNPGEVARHLDDVKTNNHIDNLEWGYEADNHEDKRKNGGLLLGSNTNKAKLTEKQVRKFYKGFKGQCSPTEYARNYLERTGTDISLSSLVAILKGTYWNHVTQHSESALEISHQLVRRIRKVYAKNKARGTLDDFCQRFAEHLESQGHEVGWVWIKRIVRGEIMTHVKP